MASQRLKRALWSVTIALVVMAGLSFVCPIHAVIARDHDVLWHLSIAGGNLRFVRLSTELNQSFLDEDSPREPQLDEWTQSLSITPTKMLSWHAKEWELLGGSSLREATFSCSLFVPLFFMLVARLRIRTICREMYRPSDRFAVPLYRRMIRRLVIALFVLGAVLGCLACVFSHTGIPSAVRSIVDRTEFLACYTGRRIADAGPRRSGDPFTLLFEREALTVQYSTLVDSQGLKTREFAKFGFRWKQHSKPTPSYWSSNIPLTDPNRTLVMRTIEVSCPYGAPILLCLLWPLIAFVRGPYRRSVRPSIGRCITCGYNLTGLRDPRCPECGTPFKMKSPTAISNCKQSHESRAAQRP